MSKKRTTDPAMHPMPVESLARMLDDALAMLEPRYTPPKDHNQFLAAPLPSLLDRCESLLGAANGRAPTRLVNGFGDATRHAGMALLKMLPNVQLLPFTSLTPGREETQPLVETGGLPGFWGEAVGAAVEVLDSGYRARGARLILHLDNRPDYDRIPADRESALSFPLRCRRPLAQVIFADHPLRSWQEMRYRCEAGYSPARLEDYAERYLSFLKDHDGVPLVTDAAVLADAARALSQIAEALELPLDSALRDEVATLDPVDFWPRSDPDGPFWRDDDNTPATEEPLDTPAYVELCSRLGYAPDSLPTLPGSCREPLARRAPHTALQVPGPDQPMALIGSLLPRLELLAGKSRAHHPARQMDAASVTRLIEDCLSHPDGFFERLDEILAGLSPADGALLMIGCAWHYAVAGQTVQGLGLLAEAVEMIPLDDRTLRILAAELFLKLRKPELAMSVLAMDALTGPLCFPVEQRDLLNSTIDAFSQAKVSEHGHALLLAHLAAHPPIPLFRRRVLIEIGTTRERIPGQGSTEKLAKFCEEAGLDFVTVDMDARNSAMARRMFARLGLRFRAITAKGEDFLAAWEGPIDYCFLDAYDFDHGNHSEVRQSRYESFLGSRISDTLCHQMHLDCAESLVEKLASDGVICFDDTWKDADGDWTAKGTTAMPFLLKHGFSVIKARDRAALLTRA